MRQGVRFLRQQRGPLPVNPGELPLIGNALIEQSQHLLIRCDPFGLAEERGGVFMRVLRPQRGTCRSGLGFGALRVLSKFRDAALGVLEVGSQLLSLRGQFLRFLGCTRFRVFDLLLFLPQVEPIEEAAPRSMFLRGRRCSGSRSRRGCNRTRFDLRVVFLLQGLDLLLWVAAGLDQILVGLFQLVLVQVELRLGEIQLVLQGVLLRLLGVSKRGGQFGHALLIRVEQRFGFPNAILDFQRLGTQLRRMRFDVPQGGREGKGERMVGHPQGRLRKGLFFGGRGEPRQPLRRRVRALIDEFRRSQCGGPLLGHPGGGRRGLPPAYAGCREQQYQ